MRDSVEAVSGEEKVNILLVDDRVENLIALRAILNPLEENIIEARSGREALRCLLEQSFAVVLLDVMMPDMDGFETAELIREREKSRLTPIIFVTAMFLEEAHAFRGYSVGAIDYIMKPFVPEILRSKVAMFVELFKKSEQVRRQGEIIRTIEQREFERCLAESRRQIDYEIERGQAQQRIAQAVVQYAPMGVVLLDNHLLIGEVNPVFCQQFDCYGLAKGINGEPIATALPWLPQSLMESIKRGEPCQVNEVSLMGDRLQANDKYWDFTSWPIKDSGGNVVNTILVSMDVTERVHLTEQRKDFVGTLAHDLQTPVIASDRALELILGRLADRPEPDLIKLVTMLKQNNHNLLHMIHSLLDVYHFEMGARALSLNKVDIFELVSSCVEELTPLIHDQGLSAECSLRGNNSIIWADRWGIRRVVTNLLDNAIKFSRCGGVIEVSVERKGGEIILGVTNSGMGISKEDQPHLFERFWHTSQHKGYKANSGLGLYLCRQIIQAHSGHIDCMSEPGTTTRFVVRLPAEPSKIAQGSLPAARDQNARITPSSRRRRL